MGARKRPYPPLPRTGEDAAFAARAGTADGGARPVSPYPHAPRHSRESGNLPLWARPFHPVLIVTIALALLIVLPSDSILARGG